MKLKLLALGPWAISITMFAAGVVLATSAYADSSRPPQIPKCNTKIGTLAVDEAQTANPW